MKLKYDFTFCHLMIDQPARPVWFLCAWSRAGHAWIYEHCHEYEQFSEYCITVAHGEKQDLLSAVAEAGLRIAGYGNIQSNDSPG